MRKVLLPLLLAFGFMAAPIQQNVLANPEPTKTTQEKQAIDAHLNAAAELEQAAHHHRVAAKALSEKNMARAKHHVHQAHAHVEAATKHIEQGKKVTPSLEEPETESGVETQRRTIK